MASITGTNLDDILEDLDSRDSIYAYEGNDTITVAIADGDLDVVYPGAGDDLITFLEGSGTGYVYELSRDGNDTIEGSASDSTIIYFYFSVEDGQAFADLGAGTVVTDSRTVEFTEVNTLRFFNIQTPISGIEVDMRGYTQSLGGSFSLLTHNGSDTVQMGDYATLIFVGSDDDLVIVSPTTSIWDDSAIDGSEGFDTIDFSDVTGAVQINLSSARAIQNGHHMLVNNMESFIGTNFGDTMTALGETTGFEFQGQGGADTLTGGDGNDTLDGGFSADSLEGGLGDDHLTGGYGDDTIIGGDGVDTAYYTGFGGGITVSLVTSGGQNTGGGGTDDLQGIENLVGGDFNDHFVGTTGANRLEMGQGSNVAVGLGGNDTLIGGNGVDNLQGGAGQDNLRGNNGRDVLDGGADDDVLWGGDDNDQLRGGAGSDTLEGFLGRDILIGGTVAGASFPGDGETDYFVFTDPGETPVGAGRDIIRDFEVGIDQIVLVDMQFGLTFIGTDAFGAVKAEAGAVRYINAGSFTIVQGDLNNDGNTDFEIRLDGTLTLTEADFILS